MTRCRTFFALLFTILLAITPHASAKEVRIGVLSIRGPEDSVKYWQQVTDYLNANISEHHFVIVPQAYAIMEKAVADGQLDFVVANPAQYIQFEVKYGASRLATLISHAGHIASAYSGSVIFVKANRSDITKLADLRGKTIITASKTAFASWLVTRDELKRQGISSDELASVQFAGASADKVVMAVKNGEADAGAVRTYVLEQLANEGKIALSDFRIINQKHVEGFPFLLSSELYPDFAFARLKHTDKRLANEVAAHLLLMAHDSRDDRYPNPIGWAVPDNYESVRTLLQKWRLPPYENYGKVPLREAIRQHGVTLALAITSVVAVVLVVYLLLNIRQRRKRYRILQEAKQKLELIHTMIESTPDAVFIKDRQGRYVFVNPEAAYLLGQSIEDIIGKGIADFFSPEHAQAVETLDGSVMSSGESVTYEDQVAVDGETRYLLVTRGPMYDSEGDLDGMFSIARDVTDLKLLQKEFSEKVVELENALEKVQQLEGIIPICSYCKKIRNDEESWQQMEHYISDHSEARFSHGICPDCFEIEMDEIRKLRDDEP